MGRRPFLPEPRRPRPTLALPSLPSLASLSPSLCGVLASPSDGRPPQVALLATAWGSSVGSTMLSEGLLCVLPTRGPFSPKSLFNVTGCNSAALNTYEYPLNSKQPRDAPEAVSSLEWTGHCMPWAQGREATPPGQLPAPLRGWSGFFPSVCGLTPWGLKDLWGDYVSLFFVPVMGLQQPPGQGKSPLWTALGPLKGLLGGLGDFWGQGNSFPNIRLVCRSSFLLAPNPQAQRGRQGSPTRLSTSHPRGQQTSLTSSWCGVKSYSSPTPAP